VPPAQRTERLLYLLKRGALDQHRILISRQHARREPHEASPGQRSASGQVREPRLHLFEHVVGLQTLVGLC
jgi:hypothetical protein